MAATISSTTQIDNLESLQRAMREWPVYFSRPAVWRGHGVAEWKLSPQVFRGFAKVESSMLWRFRAGAGTRAARIPHDDDLVGWLHLAQHYGVPTRLLDWTESPLVALYFACFEKKHEGQDGCMWAFQPSTLNQKIANYESMLVPTMKNEAAPFYRRAFSLDQRLPDHPYLAIAPNEIDLRMQVQQASFTIHRDEADLSALNSEVPILVKFIVPAKAKQGLGSMLRACGVSHGSLFPDLGGLAIDIRSRFSVLGN